MLTPDDYALFKSKGISAEQISEQLNSFHRGFPFLEIIHAAEPGKGIKIFDENELAASLQNWNEFLKTDAGILKFVPASGAASRMFKDLFEFLDSDDDTPVKPAEIKFFEEISHFAFYEELNDTCLKNNGLNISELIAAKKFKVVVANLLLNTGLNYGALPKGLLRFHTYADAKRTPMQEHLVEGAMYAKSNGQANLHFTVSTEHRALFEKHLDNCLDMYEKQFNCRFKVSFSEQKPSTDTVAADAANQPFRENGQIIFRPGGHGALIENLNDLDADIIFIKNIDNVVPDSLKASTITYKKALAGYLTGLRKTIFGYLQELENVSVSAESLKTIEAFCRNELNNTLPVIDKLSQNELREYLFGKLNRPIRVCGMVKNTGEPGGGPFITVNQDGTTSPQILESSQIDLANPTEKAKMMQSTHFNPVDLVCSVKNYQGKKFDLLKFVDKNTGFISSKSKNGKELKALELPGLWNGAMSNWNTVFVEVPIETFNPVKTVNDLLRPQHQ